MLALNALALKIKPAEPSALRGRISDDDLGLRGGETGQVTKSFAGFPRPNSICGRPSQIPADYENSHSRNPLPDDSVASLRPVLQA